MRWVYLDNDKFESNSLLAHILSPLNTLVDVWQDCTKPCSFGKKTCWNVVHPKVITPRHHHLIGGSALTTKYNRCYTQKPLLSLTPSLYSFLGINTILWDRKKSFTCVNPLESFTTVPTSCSSRVPLRHDSATTITSTKSDSQWKRNSTKLVAFVWVLHTTSNAGKSLLRFCCLAKKKNCANSCSHDLQSGLTTHSPHHDAPANLESLLAITLDWIS